MFIFIQSSLSVFKVAVPWPEKKEDQILIGKMLPSSATRWTRTTSLIKLAALTGQKVFLSGDKASGHPFFFFLFQLRAKMQVVTTLTAHDKKDLDWCWPSHDKYLTVQTTLFL